MIKAFIFDLDGVIVDTAKYHYLAWKKISDELGLNFDIHDNELLKGVSRRRSFEIILELNNLKMSDEKINEYCTIKNNYYLEYIDKLKPEEILPGAREFLIDSRKQGLKIALGSASKNSRKILDKLQITDLFDVIIDGTKVNNAKPDPEVFLKGAEELNVDPKDCVVFEDSAAGISAAHNGGMKSVGVGNIAVKGLCHYFVDSFVNVNPKIIAKKVAGE